MTVGVISLCGFRKELTGAFYGDDNDLQEYTGVKPIDLRSPRLRSNRSTGVITHFSRIRPSAR
jgi:hypothetical protein